MNYYGYVFLESTGPNQYIAIEGRRNPIQFDNASNQMALKSLHALKGGILYENSGGDRIFVGGEYDGQKQSFRLSHWYIKVPFQEAVMEDEARLPHTVSRRTRQSLERTDFEPTNGFNPNDATFDPTSFQKNAQ